MRIRHSQTSDLPGILRIYARARKFMVENGNPNQWSAKNWPPQELVESDILAKKSYVCVHNGNIVGTFFYDFGKNSEPTYNTIKDGAWLSNAPYGVIHRIASDGTVRGTASFCLDWAFKRCGHLRIDTHGDNSIMQNLLKKNGFVHCGTIYVTEDTDPRLAFEKTVHS